MNLPKNQPSAPKLSLFTTKNYSIKWLAIWGFSLVALPLVIALIYSAMQVSHLSEKSSAAILNVAQITKNNKELQQIRTKMERYASQYIVLADAELLTSYLNESRKLPALLQHNIASQANTALSELTVSLLDKIKIIEQYLLAEQKISLSLTKLQSYFIELAQINQQINELTNNITTKQATTIKQATEQVSANLLLGLWVIPIAVIIAFIFISLITKPLKLLISKIKQLEFGQSEQVITVNGSSEIKAIAAALEMMRTQLHSLELQKSSFIRHISHELKTPLAAIREGTELLYDNSVGELNAEQHEISQIIRVSVNKLQQLIEDLLDFNVVLDSTSLQNTERLTLLPIIENTLNERQLDLKRKNLNVNLRLDNIELYSNEKQLNVILDNILSNAIKYSPCNETIKIEGLIKKHQIIVKITDHGMGISPSAQEKIFDAFYQGPAPEDGTIKSSGLGLTIVKELMMRLNGEVTLTSQTKSPSFTTFSLIFPRTAKTKVKRALSKEHE
ncbi:MAG: ATP-binding protein [Thalassotalea sp.]